jgi:hypothetical protein
VSFNRTALARVAQPAIKLGGQRRAPTVRKPSGSQTATQLGKTFLYATIKNPADLDGALAQGIKEGFGRVIVSFDGPLATWMNKTTDRTYGPAQKHGYQPPTVKGDNHVFTPKVVP